MAIGEGAAIDFFGTQDTVITTTGTIADDAFSSDVTDWTNDDDADQAVFVLGITFATAADTASFVNLYARLMNIDSTNDAETPDAGYKHYKIGSFPINDGTTSAQYIAIKAKLPNTMSSQVYNFFLENKTGQTASTGATLKVTPITKGPHPA